ncbi:MAG: hypothetical protein OEV49_04685 [candidate division Zixibacteria bacterium]|nr:hypothetical protein [candidate division Zixibacteria bacterium]MDH3938701.1 hypothetical protein [candidate division Zixibacteria bacterium]MDH4035083.1 hypothetical protein [candidate division Zixibacteria bacterium]
MAIPDADNEESDKSAHQRINPRDRLTLTILVYALWAVAGYLILGAVENVDISSGNIFEILFRLFKAVLTSDRGLFGVALLAAAIWISRIVFKKRKEKL